MKRQNVIFCSLAMALSLLSFGAIGAFAQGFCSTSSVPTLVSPTGTNEVLGSIVLYNCTGISSTASVITAGISAPVTPGTGLLISSVPFVVAPTLSQSGNVLTFRFTPAAGSSSFTILGIGANIAASGITFPSQVSALLTTSPFFITNNFLNVAIPGTSVVQGRLDTVAGLSGLPGSTVNIPVSLNLNSGVTANSLSFTLKIVANGTAPALTGSLVFNKAITLPAPTTSTSGSDVIQVSWPSGLSLSGASSLGTVAMVIPPGAFGGPTYTLWLTTASATSGGSNLIMDIGPTNTLNVTFVAKKRPGQIVSE